MRKAEKMARGVSMAADRRAQRFGEFSVEPPGALSETQRHDVFEHETKEQSNRVENSRKLCGNDPIDCPQHPRPTLCYYFVARWRGGNATQRFGGD